MPSKDHDDYLLIKGLFNRGKGRYGYRTIQMKLASDLGIAMNHKKILRIMREHGLLAKVRRRNPYKNIAKKTEEHRSCENILAGNFKQHQPFKFLCTDITYLPTSGGLAYLSAVKDIATREIVGWSLSRQIGMELVLDTIASLKENAKARNERLAEALIHSDQGFHYTNPSYIFQIRSLAMTQSMSRKGNCLDNAPMESFFGHFKDEVDYAACRTFEELKQLVSEHIEYYNNRRYQWELKKMTPVGYRNHLLNPS